MICQRSEYATQETMAPPHHGLVISLVDGETCLEFVKDSNLDSLHPFIHVPASAQRPAALTGGGSGVTVLRAFDPVLGESVMKHGSFKDTRELLSLVSIHEQLRLRGCALAKEAAGNLMARLPKFKFLYISQGHIWDRAAELWNIVKLSRERLTSKCKSFDDVVKEAVLKKAEQESSHLDHEVPRRHKKSAELFLICRRREDGSLVRLVDEGLEVYFDGVPHGSQFLGANGAAFLKEFGSQLAALQQQHAWKFTLAQHCVGGDTPKTGAVLLTSGQLHGERLSSLVDGMLTVVRDLEKLTFPSEAEDGVGHARNQFASIATPTSLASDVPDTLDAFVGFAVKKNYHESTGRFARMWELGSLLRDGLLLTDGEILPGHLLGTLLQAGSQMQDVFGQGPLGPSPLDTFSDWKSLVDHATSLRGRAAKRVWTSGLTDAGLHNLFVGNGLWFFDLGEPSLMALPAFLTKFLMSFFHTLGMTDCSEGWVNRFALQPVRLTADTSVLLCEVYKAFRHSLDRLVQELFDGERAVHDLLVQYVVLQLLSDAGFCLERWQVKGGGQRRFRPQPLEKWLWRALWDLYVAADILGQEWASGLPVKWRTRS